MPRARVRSASGLGMRGRLDPKRLALRYRTRVAAGGCQSHDRRSGTGGKTDRFPDYAARLRRELAQPRPGSTGLSSLRRRDRIVDPSIESVQPTCQRSAPGFRVGCRPNEHRTGGCRGSRRFTHFDPLANSRLRLSLPMLRASGKSLVLLGLEETGLAATVFHENPTPVVRAHRVTGEREQHDEGTPSAGDDVRGRRRRRLGVSATVPFAANLGSPGPLARCRCIATATTATRLLHQTPLADFCNRRETRAHPPVKRFPARSCGYPHERCF
jgi:hypothetical protein